MGLKIVIGGQYGDEGKGKIISYLASKKRIDAFVRAGVGPNAGHTVVHNGKTYKLRVIPSGFLAPNAKMLIGAGVLINLDVFYQEIEKTGLKDQILIDHHTGVITQEHIDIEKNDKYLMETIGSTGSGCGPAGVDRINRKLKLAQDYPELAKYTTDVSDEINDILDKNGNVIVEGSQATFLSLYHGTYPYVTSKDVCASACLSDIGVGPTRCEDVIIVLKSYITRVGKGYLDGELPQEELERRGWQEFGTVTGRPRRGAPFDFELARKAVRLNGATNIALTKIDVMFPANKGKTNYDDLTDDAKEFIRKVEEATRVRVKYISTGASSEELIERC